MSRKLLGVVLAVIALIAGALAAAPQTLAGQTIKVDPQHVKFGKQPHHSFTTKSFTVTNVSSETVSVSIESTFVPDDFSPGQIESTCPWGTSVPLAGGESCAHVIGYYADPAEPFRGRRQIELQVVARDGSGQIIKSRTVKVIAEGVPG